MEARYARSVGPLSETECLSLRDKRVFLAGCGGLGGYLLEFLLRLGVGRITVCDGDRVDETNLNRQLLADRSTLGLPKTQAALRRAALVNPQVEVRAIPEFLTEANADALLSGHHLALDALDSADARRVLSAACARQGIPLVHGAVQGWFAQAAVAEPGSGLLDRLYPEGAPEDKNKGCLPFTPALCAALQCAEAVKLLCGRSAPLTGRLLCADLLDQDVQVLPL